MAISGRASRTRMRGRSYTPSPPRGDGGRGRNHSPRGRDGGHSRDMPTGLLVHNLRHDCRREDLCRPFGLFGALKDIYLRRDYYSGELRGFGFIQYVNPGDATEAKYHMDGYVLMGHELTVVFAVENRRKPTEMRAREHARSISTQEKKHGQERSYSPRPSCERSVLRCPPVNGLRTRSRSPSRGRARSLSLSSPPPEDFSREANGDGSTLKAQMDRSTVAFPVL